MHLIRRSAFRAASSHAAFSSRSISSSSSTPFVVRAKAAKAFAPTVCRRFNSDEASREKEHENDRESGSVKSAVEAANEYVGEAAESVGEHFEQAKESVVGAAAAVGAATGAYTPREPREPRGYGNDRGGERGGYGGDRGGYGGGRSMQGGGDRGFAPPARILTPNNGIYIGNLLFDITAADLKREFEQFGPIVSSTIATDSRGLSKGFGYLEFETTEQATSAIEAKHQSVLEGRRLVVNYMNRTNARPRGETPPSKTLFIGNLAFEMSDADLNKLFRDIRNVIDVRVAIDRRTGQPRGFAHADFIDVESAIKAKESLTGKEVYGRALRVDYSAGVTRGDGAPSNGRGGGGGYDRQAGDRRGNSSF